jgi:uncharacterized damage-inducible protein DinB
MLSPFSRSYVLRGVTGTPAVLRYLLQGLDSNAEIWDFRPDPERFTLREVLAHLADYDEVTIGRFQRFIDEDSPELPNWDENEAVVAGNYAATDPLAKLAQFTASRQKLGEFLAGLSDAEWVRTASRPKVGQYTLEEGVVLLLAHDTYHVQQAAEWLEKFTQRS